MAWEPCSRCFEIDGHTEALLAAGVELERRLGIPDGLLARIVAPDGDGHRALAALALTRDGAV